MPGRAARMKVDLGAGAVSESVPPKFRSAEELAMRDLIVPELRLRWPQARIVHELPLRYSERRIDLAAITETEIVSVEIKSSRDVADRLEAQLRGFIPVSTRVIVALAPKWNVDLPSIERPGPSGRGTRYTHQFTAAQAAIQRVGTSSVSVWEVCAETGRVDPGYERHEPRQPWAAKMLDVLWVAELLRVAIDHAVPIHGTSPHDVLVRACCDAMTGRDVTRAVCRGLRARIFPQADAPIGVAGAATAELALDQAQ